MIKGARKEMIVVRTGNSRYFDEAYFVLREDVQKDKKKSKDILEEANRILAEIAPEPSHTQKKKQRDGRSLPSRFCKNHILLAASTISFTHRSTPRAPLSSVRS